ncbi:flagellar basal body protein (plasmid) [Roseivivax marinus]|nr:flagellar basal body protein [Roseivivax marinus]
MRWLSARQQVVSENIANSDTPGYRAREVSGFDELMSDAAPMQGLTRTRANHIAGTTPEAGVRVQDDPEAWEASIDGNTVVLEQQMMKASDIADGYRLAADLYQKGHELLTLAATGRR